MNNYDYGYELIPGTTTFWAYEKIDKNSIVLELGPAVGNLAKHLKEEKECVIDIIEIDEEAGKKASAFARHSLLGAEDGDLEKDYWLNALSMVRYDYIVILDVLEHLKNADIVLKQVSSLLKDDGKILISIPNIAHNSVLINLINNKFIYTRDGLLDNTHVKFYTYDTFILLLHQCGLIAVGKETKQIPVEMTEVGAVYADVPENIEEFLRGRYMSDVYQFLFVVQKENFIKKEDAFVWQPLNETGYKFQIYPDGLAEKCVTCYFNSCYIDYTVEFNENLYCSYLRIDPLEFKCVVRIISLDAKVDGNKISLQVKATNGIEIGRNLFCFLSDDPNIYIDMPEGIEEFRFTCQCYNLNSNMLTDYKLIVDQNEKYKSQIEYDEGVVRNLRDANQTKEIEIFQEKEVNKNLSIEIANQKEVNRILDEKNKVLDEEINTQRQINYALENELTDTQQAVDCLKDMIGSMQKEIDYFRNLWFVKSFLKIKQMVVKIMNKWNK